MLNILVKVLNESRYDNVSAAELATANKYQFFNAQIHDNVSTLFMMISSEDQDEFKISCDLVKEEHIEYFTTVSNPELNSLKKEMNKIKHNLVNFIEDFMAGYFTATDLNDLKEISEENTAKISEAVKFLSNWIFDFMSRDSTLAKAKYFKQMICAEFNLVEVLLTIIRILSKAK
jgi:hypothetical protein